MPTSTVEALLMISNSEICVRFRFFRLEKIFHRKVRLLISILTDRGGGISLP